MTAKRAQYEAPEGVVMTRATYRLPQPLLDEIDRLADKHGRSINAEVVAAIEGHVQRAKGEKR